MSRKIRWRAWAAFLVGGLPFLIGLPILLGFRAAYGGMFWSRPMWEEAVWTYSTYLGTSITAALLLLAFLTLALYGSAPFSRTSGVQQGDRTFSVAEMALLVAFLWLPAVLVFVVKLSGGGYTARYGWPAVFAFVVAIIAIGWQNERTRKPLLAALLIAFAYQVRVDARQMHATASPPATRWAALAAVSEREPGVPVVIASPISYLEAAQYAPAAIKDRLVGVFDLQKQAALFGTDTPDRANRLLVLITRLQLQGPIAFEAAHGRFLVYSGGDYDWFTPHLLAHDYRLRLLAVDRGHPMYIVESATPSK